MFSERRLGWAGDLWIATGAGPGLVPADGCVDLIWRDGRIELSPPTTMPFHASAESGRSIGLRLRPGLAGLLFGLPVAELTDQCVPLADVAGKALPKSLLGGDLHRPEAMLTQALNAAQAAADPVALHRWAQLIRQADATAPATEAAAMLGCSVRQLRRDTARMFGYGYRTLSRIRRAQRAAQGLRAGGSPAEVAARAGFADQPHLTRELRALIGRTPAQLVASNAKRSTELPSGSLTVA